MTAVMYLERFPLAGVRVPGVTRPGTQSAEAVSLLDIYPTLMDLCGLPVSKQPEVHSVS
jgi:arylsulfatase A-like enzyme